VSNAADDPRFDHLIISQDIPNAPEEAWFSILPRTKLGPHRRHHFQLQNVEGVLYSHVRLTIYPDGGVKRLRIIGKRVSGGLETDSSTSITPNVTDEPSLISERLSEQQLKDWTHRPRLFLPFHSLQKHLHHTAMSYRLIAHQSPLLVGSKLPLQTKERP
jgi:hypothetical protein